MPTPEQPQAWQRHPATLLVAVLLGCGPAYGLAIWSGLTGDAGAMPIPSVLESAANALLTVGAFGGLMLVVMWLLNGELPGVLQLKPGRLASDIGQGIGVWLGLIAAQIVFMLAYSWISGAPAVPPAFNAHLGKALAADPWLMAVWVTLVAWVQAGFLEEYARAFMLSRLWRVWPSPVGRYLVLVCSSLLFGMGHMYQGLLGVFGTALIGLLLGDYYLRHGRVLPLIIGHGLYNSCAMLALALSSTLPGHNI
jgi:membrane protease YdiL (CAAX protease family)